MTKEYEQKVREVLENPSWLSHLSVGSYLRTHDDCDGDITQTLTVTVSRDGDCYIQVLHPMGTSLRFRTVPIGGGASPRTWAALRILAEAIRLDNEDNEIR